MSLSPGDWHLRFQQQANWTRDLRRYLLERSGAERAFKVLSVGCGTGAVLQELGAQVSDGDHLLFGLDIDERFLDLARVNVPQALVTCGDGHQLPYAGASFDLSLCHFLLLWVADPGQVLAEMRRVTRSGHPILALAEPDYGGRIDYPVELEPLGKWQTDALRHQGANPQIGRELAGLFTRAGFKDVESGVLGGQWSGPPTQVAWESEWDMLRSDLVESVPMEKLARLKIIDQRAWQRGERVLFVPTFYAWGVVP